MYRTVFTPSEISDLTIQLPKEYLHRQVEVIAFDVIKEGREISNSIESKRERIIQALESLPKVSTKGYKFDRDEANER